MNSTLDVSSTIDGPSVRRLANHRHQRARVGGAAVVATAAVAVAVGVPALVDGTATRSNTAPSSESPAGNSTSAAAEPVAPSTAASPSSIASSASPSPLATEPAPVITADADVFADVVAGAFPMPGPTQRRTIRVRLNSTSIANVACGGKAFPDLNSTASRFDQSRYADLDLIAQKGLVEPPPAEVPMAELNDCVKTVLPSWADWRLIGFNWEDASAGAVKSPAVTATKATVASCAKLKYGLDVDSSDPVSSLLAAGGADQPDAASVATKRRADAIVACTGSYFHAVESQLAPQRDLAVERNRPLLERFASELTAAGYVPSAR